jgi:hypothetical protein
MLVAAAILTAMIGGLLQVLQPMQARVAAEGERIDLQQRLRVAADRVAATVGQAGAGPLVGGVRGPLGRWTATILPYRIGRVAPDPPVGVRFRSDAVSVLTVPLTASQALLHQHAPAGTTSLSIDWPDSCPPSTPLSVCGFREGTHALVVDGTGRAEMVLVSAATADRLDLDGAGLSWPFRAGAVVVEASIRSLALRVDAAGVSRLSQYDGFGGEFPLVDHVERLEFSYFGDPRPPTLQMPPPGAPGDPTATYGAPPPAPGYDDPDDAWPAGENCLFRMTGGAQEPRLSILAPTSALVPLPAGALTDGPWCPDAGNPRAFDADLLRVRRVRVRLRLQAAAAGVRGPAGPLFARPGTARAADRLVPDLEVQFDVVPANLRAVS